MRPSNRDPGVKPTGADSGGGGGAEYAFRFVEVVGEALQSQDEDARSVIRSHVMRDYYERRGRATRPSATPQVMSAASKKEGVAQQMHRFKVGPDGLREVKKGRRKNAKLQSTEGACSNTIVDVELQAEAEKQVHTFTQADASTLVGLESQSRHFQDAVPQKTQHLTANNSVLGAKESLPLLRPRSGQRESHPAQLPAGATLTDPFNTLPLTSSPHIQILLYHANRGILSSRLMGQLRTEWLSLATQDTALFYVALSHYAGNYSLSKKQSDPIEALRFRMESMKLINARLEDVKSAVGDGTLGTVASLSSYEATNGSLEAIHTHMRGLQRLIELRGGLKDPNMSPYTKRLVLWADLNCANALGTDSVFPTLDPSDICTADLQHKSYINSHEETEAQTDAGEWNLKRLSLELKENFTSLKYLSKIDSDDQAHCFRTKIQQIQNSDMLYLTERSLQRLSNLWGPRKFVSSGCIAAIIFLDNSLRGIQFNARIMDRLVARLHHSMMLVLDEISQHDGSKHASKAIFWVLFVGGVASGVRLEREWFLAHLIDFSHWIDVQSWEGAEAILKDFLWTRSWDRLGLSLWAEIEEARLMNMITWPEKEWDAAEATLSR